VVMSSRGTVLMHRIFLSGRSVKPLLSVCTFQQNLPKIPHVKEVGCPLVRSNASVIIYSLPPFKSITRVTVHCREVEQLVATASSLPSLQKFCWLPNEHIFRMVLQSLSFCDTQTPLKL